MRRELRENILQKFASLRAVLFESPHRGLLPTNTILYNTYAHICMSVLFHSLSFDFFSFVFCSFFLSFLSFRCYFVAVVFFFTALIYVYIYVCIYIYICLVWFGLDSFVCFGLVCSSYFVVVLDRTYCNRSELNCLARSYNCIS